VFGQGVDKPVDLALAVVDTRAGAEPTRPHGDDDPMLRLEVSLELFVVVKV